MNLQNENIIRILPDFIANQIAAGEVVQRPESIVKELVENSIDAGATSVVLAVKNAGKTLVHVIDNGSGMSRQDLELSVKRHATSKVFSSEDLETIKTFGFRGEALASVCSVANVEIRTQQTNDPHGWRLISEPMKEPVIEPVKCDTGTQIFVRNLFYNVPARRKFLKSNLTEFRYISDTIIKIALAKPEIRFTFYDDDTLIFDIKPSDLKERIISLLGQSVKESLIPIEYQNDFVVINGYVGEPHLARQSRSGQYFFLNGRSILSNSLSHAVFSCYEELLDKNQKPLFVLNIGIDYSKVDVNVHPQKHEVKFDDERFVYNSIKSAVLKSLNSHQIIPDINLDLINAANPFTKIYEGNSQLVVNKMTGEVVSTSQNYQSENFGAGNRENNIIGKASNITHSAFDEIFGKTGISQDFQLQLPENLKDRKYYYFSGRFIIVDLNEYIIVIDQSGFQQRIIYDRALKSHNTGGGSVQDLLFPVTVELNSNQSAILKKSLKDIESIGFRIEVTEDSAVFNGLPDTIRQGKEEESVRRFLNELSVIETSLLPDLFDKICSSYSEAAAIKNGFELTDAEIRNMLGSLKNYKIPVYSPRGKKSVIKLTSQEFYNKLFFSS